MTWQEDLSNPFAQNKRRCKIKSLLLPSLSRLRHFVCIPSNVQSRRFMPTSLAPSCQSASRIQFLDSGFLCQVPTVLSARQQGQEMGAVEAIPIILENYTGGHQHHGQTSPQLGIRLNVQTKVFHLAQRNFFHREC